MADNKKPPDPEPDNFGMPENWVPTSSAPIIPGVSSSVGAPPSPYVRDQFNSGALPSNFGLQTDLAKTSYGGWTAEARLMPVQGGPGDNAKTVSIVTQAINAIPPTVIPPAAPAGGPFLALGDPIDYPQIDPASFILVDDFATGTTGANLIGELGWFATSSGTGAAITVNQSTIPAIGGVRLATGTVTNGFEKLALSTIQTSGASIYNEALAILDYPGWKIVFDFIPFRAAYCSAAGSFDWGLKQSFYIGLALTEQSIAGRPSIFAGLRLDTDTTAPSIGDSTFWFECVSNAASAARNNTQGNVHNTGVTPVEFQEYRLEITCTVAGKFNFSLNGSAPITLSMPTYTAGGGTGSSTISNNIAVINYAGGTSAISAFGNGSKIAVSGLTGTHAVLNGNQVVLQGGQNQNTFFSSTATLSTQNDSIVATGFPALCPYICSGNDSSATPTSKQAGIDFFMLLYNPKLATSWGNPSPDPTLPRYYPAQT